MKKINKEAFEKFYNILVELENKVKVGGDIMNVLKDLVNEKVMIKTVLGEETYYFMWNAPATAEDIQAFENRNECSLPDDYKESLFNIQRICQNST